MLATGGAAALWRRTTNPWGAIGAGPVLGAAAGADLADLEFCQFHPTALAMPGTPHDGRLITEAVRGEGATLLDASGRRFTDELAARDAVTAAILARLEADGTTDVKLDLRGIDPARFPNVFAALAEAGLDPAREPVPVTPAAHYMMGGIAVDIDGRSSLPGLYAVGECSCTGLHGANRLASNSLSECFVFGRRAAAAALAESAPAERPAPPDWRFDPPTEETRDAVWRLAGPIRDAARLERLSSDPYPLAAAIGTCALPAASRAAATCAPTSPASTPSSTAPTSSSPPPARPAARPGRERGASRPGDSVTHVLLGVDVGGTFTDAVLVDGERIHTAKRPTTADDQSRGVIARGRRRPRPGRRLPIRCRVLRPRDDGRDQRPARGRGARTALIATGGFADVLEIARQDRPHLYRLCAPPPTPLVEPGLRFEAAERVGPEGVVEPLGAGEPARLAAAVRESGAESVAICLLFSYLDPEHERLLAEHLRDELPGVHVSASHEVLPRFREYERCSTTAIDAYLSPLLGAYLGRLERAAADAGLPAPLVMQSSGGVAPAREAARAGAWSVLSGPAGGAVGAGLVARASGDGNAIGFDMGGTSCDVCVVEEGEVRRTDSRQIEGRTIQLPMVDVHTVGAGGGSIGWRDRGGGLRVGPRSAGAQPGPACYGRGGTEPTVTDANLLLGRLAGDSRLAGGVELDADAARRRRARARRAARPRRARDRGGDRADRQPGDGPRPARRHRRARGRPAPLRPAPLRRRRPDARGGDRRRAGHRADPLPAGRRRPLRARALRLRPPSRHGAHRDARGRGAERRARRRGGRATWSRSWPASGLPDAEPEVVYEMRYSGQAFELPVPGPPDPDPADLVERFEPRTRTSTATATRRQRRPRPHRPGDGLPRAAAAARSAAAGASPSRGRARCGSTASGSSTPGPPRRARRRHRGGGPGRLRASRGDLRRAARLGRRVDEAGTILAEAAWLSVDPITLQVLSGGLRAACDEMGAALIRSAYSANIKERRDCSTALFDAAGRAGDAGRAHPGPPRLDARRGRRGARRAAAARRDLDPQRPLSRRDPPARHHPDLAGLRATGR